MSIFDTDQHHPSLSGPRATESAHRKVELQSPADLTYLIANVARAARERLDRHLPPLESERRNGNGKEGLGAGERQDGGDDGVRRRVEGLVDEYIWRTFDAAKDSVSINGMGAREMEAELAKVREGEELEPFDTRLAHRIQSLSADIEKHTLALANLRRTAPASTSQRFRAAYTASTTDAKARLLRQREERVAAAAAEGEGVLGGVQVQRVGEVRGSWRDGMEGLGELRRGLGGTVARLERAREGVRVVGGE